MFHSLARGLVCDGNVFQRLANRIRENLHLFAYAEGLRSGQGIDFPFVTIRSQRTHRNRRDVARVNGRQLTITIV